MSGERITEHNRIKLAEVIFEVTRVGKMVRVNAIDPITGVEVTSIAPVSVGKNHWERLAKRKLEYVLTKKLRKKKEGGGTDFLV
jgi:hypothetical protein